jgi:predicted hydrocarbon binding protein
MTDSSTTRMVGVALPTLRELRSAILTGSEPDAAVSALREAGYAGGDDVFAAFEQWLSESDDSASADTGDLALDEFGEKAAQFFRDAGWGDVTFTPDDAEGVAVIDIANCWESGNGSAQGTGCQITTGLLAAFFGRIAGYPVAVLETECCDGDGSQCRFLLGNADVMAYKWAELQNG